MHRRSGLGTVARAATGVIAPALAAGAGLVVGETRTTAAALLFLLAVLGAALGGGLTAGLIASALSFVGLNYLFTPPLRTFSVGKTDDLIALVVFLAVGAIVSTLLTMVRSAGARARRGELEARSMAAVGATLSESGDLQDACRTVVTTACDVLGLEGCSVEIGPLGAVVASASTGRTDGRAEELPVGFGATVGTLRLYAADGLGEPQRRVAMALGHQLAAAVERWRLEREAVDARMEAESGRMRRALLSTVSHDFRTPLAAIKAAVTSLRDELPTGAREELLGTAHEEVERLERLIDNLLDLTRIRSGSLAPDCAPVGLDEVLERAVAGARGPLTSHPLELDVPTDLPDVLVDVVQVSHALRNVIENAAKFSPPASPIVVRAREYGGGVEVRVIDRGPGVEPAEREAVFAELYRAGDQRVAGTGLGLAIARAIAEAHGGRITIEGTPGGGATVVVSLPASVARAADAS